MSDDDRVVGRDRDVLLLASSAEIHIFLSGVNIIFLLQVRKGKAKENTHVVHAQRYTYKLYI